MSDTAKTQITTPQGLAILVISQGLLWLIMLLVGILPITPNSPAAICFGLCLPAFAVVYFGGTLLSLHY